MLNRPHVSIYFIQKKRFLDDDVDYLETRLKTTQKTYGADTFPQPLFIGTSCAICFPKD